MTPGKLRQWVEAIRTQESGYQFSEGLVVGDAVPGGAPPLPGLEVLATVSLEIRALRVHSLHVRAAASQEDPDGVPVHIMRLIGQLEDGEEVEILREAVPGPSEGAVPEAITCVACDGRIWDHDIGQSVIMDGQLYHHHCVLGGNDHDDD